MRSGVAVDRAAGRGVDDAPRRRPARGLEHVDRADDVDRRVEGRVLDRLAHVDLRGQVEDDVGRDRGDERGERRRVADVDLVQARAAVQRARLEVLAPPGDEVVDDVDLVAARRGARRRGSIR